MKTKWGKNFFAIIFTITITITFTSLLPAQPKDSGKVYKVAILPFQIHSQENLDYLREGIYDMLSSRIVAEGKIIVVERSVVEKAFYEERPMRLDETVAKRIGMRAGADYIVLGSLTKIGEYISLDARLISITEEKPALGAFTQHKGIEDVMVKIGEFAQDIGYKITGQRATVSRPGDPRHPYIATPRKEIGSMGFQGELRSQTFPFEIKGIDIGDINGDKKNELVIMDRHNLYVFNYDGERLKYLYKIEHGSEHNFLTLDVADVNRNGVAEIVVTSVVGEYLQSFILEYEEGKFKKVTEDAAWYFRVLDHPKEGPLLMGQNMGSDGLYSGPVYKFLWKKRGFEKGPKMDFPKGTKIFGFTVADIRNPGTFDVVRLEDSQRLTILSPDGKSSWNSRVRYGGTDNFYDTSRKTVDGFQPHEAPPYRVYIPGRVLAKDLDRDGIKEIIVNRNERSTTIFERAGTYEIGEIYSLIWQEGSLETQWRTREIKGYFSDFQVKDVDNDGDEELVVALVNVGDTAEKKGTSNILFFELF